MFQPGSRYENLGSYEAPDGRGGTVKLCRARFIPATPGVLARRVLQHDRPDLLAHEYYARADLFWRLADANLVIDPAELVMSPGIIIQIPNRP